MAHATDMDIHQGSNLKLLTEVASQTRNERLASDGRLCCMPDHRVGKSSASTGHFSAARFGARGIRAGLPATGTCIFGANRRLGGADSLTK